MKPEYQAWIDEHYPTQDSARFQCKKAARDLAVAFPELRVVRGHSLVCGECRARPHWWCETEEGVIVDPTAHQWFGGIERYERLSSEEEPHGRCMNCGELLFASKNAGSYLCYGCRGVSLKSLGF
jgi:hypothetical protein